MRQDVYWNIAGTSIMVLTTLITVPLFLHFYGAERYGILVTAWGLLGYFSLLDLGMGPAVVSALSRRDPADLEGTARIFWTAVLANLGIGTCVALIALVASSAFRPATASTFAREIVDALPVFALMLPISLVYPILVGALDARRMFGLANLNQVLGSVLFQLLPLALVLVLGFPATLKTAATGSLIGRAMSAAILLWWCISSVRVGRPRFDRSSLRTLAASGGWMAVSSSASVFLDTADRFVVSYILGGAAGAWYAIANNTVSRVRSLPAAVIRALFPRVASDPAGSRSRLFRSVRVLSLVLAPTVSAAIVLAEPLLTLWLGVAAAIQIAPLARVMLLGIFLNCLAPVPLGALQASGAPGTVARIHLIQLPFFLAAMVLATMHFGVFGAAMMWTARVTLDAALMFRAARMQRSFWREGLVPALLPLCTFGLVVGTAAPSMVKAAIALGLIAAWAILDWLAARATGETVTLLTLGKRTAPYSSSA